ncbi:TonB-dependent receptor plug domain-containing protein [Marinobacterium weihaiense]|uniref:TonB-dependent receptor plug domain-containing protein n=1 Tax=Marinobacterium weihaiense TaxID=2851016 RepID=A0ABS6MDT3_9GAMM|nr:TonB-dependent receptor plug domain-containing protein [Marinobacterium weihaiense]MBV0934461.1 TonB-dependent receptor plug domain-containing protein [Marinobacterium weihaiense]
MARYLPPWHTLALFTLPLLSPLSLANEQLYLSEQAFLTDIPEITSATRLSQRLTDAPASISILSRDVITASGARNIPDLLRLVPGFQSYHVGANTFATTYHGASDNFPRRLEVMVDGRSVYLPLLATVDWTSLGLNLQDIERIEVVRGSNVPTQGSNAFMGSINIITREPASQHGGYVSASAGSLNTRDLQFSHADALGLWNYQLSGGHEQNDGLDRFDDGLNRNYLRLSTSYTPTLQDTLWLQAGVDRGHTHAGQAGDVDDRYYRRDHEAHYQYIKYQNLYSDTGTLQLTAYHNYLDLSVRRQSFKETQLLLDDSLQGMPFYDSLSPEQKTAFVRSFMDLNPLRVDPEHGTTHTYDTELQLTDRLGRLDLVAGSGYRYETAESDVLLQEGPVSEERWRLFANAGWDLTPRWRLASGFMYEDSSEGTDAFSYRHALLHHPDPHSSLRLGYSLSERLPSLLERHTNSTIYLPSSSGPVVVDYNARANKALDTERMNTLELSYYRHLETLDGHLDIRIFQEELTSMIDAYFIPLPPGMDMDDPPRVGQGDNRFSWQNRGAEIRFRHQPSDSFWYLLNYAYINTRTDTWERGAKKIKTFEDATTPEHTASLLLNWQPRPALNLSLGHYYMDHVDWFEGDWRDAYHRTDVRAAYNWQLTSRSELEAALTIQNAFGPTYSEFYRYNQFDRRTWLQLTLRYQ